MFGNRTVLQDFVLDGEGNVEAIASLVVYNDAKGTLKEDFQIAPPLTPSLGDISVNWGNPEATLSWDPGFLNTLRNCRAEIQITLDLPTTQKLSSNPGFGVFYYDPDPENPGEVGTPLDPDGLPYHFQPNHISLTGLDILCSALGKLGYIGRRLDPGALNALAKQLLDFCVEEHLQLEGDLTDHWRFYKIPFLPGTVQPDQPPIDGYMVRYHEPRKWTLHLRGGCLGDLIRFVGFSQLSPPSHELLAGTSSKLALCLAHYRV